MTLILPFNEIKIGPYNFEAIQVPHLMSDDYRKLVGQIDFLNFKIRFDEDITDEMAKTTAIHEIIHGVFRLMNVNDEETLIGMLEPWILLILRQNKNLLRWVVTEEGVPLVTEDMLVEFLKQTNEWLSVDARAWLKGDKEGTLDIYTHIAEQYRTFLQTSGLMEWATNGVQE